MAIDRDMTCSVVGRCCESGDIIQEEVQMPSTIKRGDVIAVAEKARSQALVNRFMSLTANAVTPDWLELDAAKLSAKLSRIPSQEEIAPIVNVQLIVEFYSR